MHVVADVDDAMTGRPIDVEHSIRLGMPGKLSIDRDGRLKRDTQTVPSVKEDPALSVVRRALGPEAVRIIVGRGNGDR